jgi:hypothetical protein
MRFYFVFTIKIDDSNMMYDATSKAVRNVLNIST